MCMCVCVCVCVCVGTPCGADPLRAPGNGHKTTATNRGSATDVGRQGNLCAHTHTHTHTHTKTETELLDGLPVT